MPGSQPTRSDIQASPRWFPHMLDPLSGQVVLVERMEADFRTAAFLDDRSLAQGAHRFAVQWDDLAAALAATARRDAQYIFHIGHVGSTLISRLLGELPSVLALREPLLLRTFAEMDQLQGQPDNPWAPESMVPRLDALTALLSRSFRLEQRAMVKATSFTSEIAPLLVPAGSKALLLYARPERYIANLLAGDAARATMNFLAGNRLKRLARRLGEAPGYLWAMGEPEKAGLAWACEMASLAGAARLLGPERVRWMDFDAFLADSAGQLSDLAGFFGHGMDPSTATALCRGPLMSRYSKALEYEYSPGLREQILAESHAGNREAIAGAMAWLHGAAARYPAIAQCIEQAA
jgi:hypothetical protein